MIQEVGSSVHPFAKKLLLTFNELRYKFWQVFLERFVRFRDCLRDVNDSVACYLKSLAEEAVCFFQDFWFIHSSSLQEITEVLVLRAVAVLRSPEIEMKSQLLTCLCPSNSSWDHPDCARPFQVFALQFFTLLFSLNLLKVETAATTEMGSLSSNLSAPRAYSPGRLRLLLRLLLYSVSIAKTSQGFGRAAENSIHEGFADLGASGFYLVA